MNAKEEVLALIEGDYHDLQDQAKQLFRAREILSKHELVPKLFGYHSREELDAIKARHEKENSKVWVDESHYLSNHQDRARLLEICESLLEDRQADHDRIAELEGALRECVTHKGWPSETPEMTERWDSLLEKKLRDCKPSDDDDSYYMEESLRQILLVATGETALPGQTGIVAAKVIERMEKDRARIAELEDKLRWRDCKTEPPSVDHEGRPVLVRICKSSDSFYEPFVAWKDDIDVWWDVDSALIYPHQWRPIE